MRCFLIKFKELSGTLGHFLANTGRVKNLALIIHVSSISNFNFIVIREIWKKKEGKIYSPETKYLFPPLVRVKRQCKLHTSVSMLGSNMVLMALSSLSCSSSFNKFSTNLRTQDTMASDAVETVRIEKISDRRFLSLLKSDTSFLLLLIAIKQEKSALGFSLLEASCLKPSIKGFTEAKKRSQKSL